VIPVSETPAPTTSAIALLAPGDRLRQEAWAVLLVGLATVSLFAVGVPILSAGYGVFVPVAFLLTTLHGASLVLALLRPGVAVAVSGAAVLLTGVLTYASTGLPWPVPVVTMIAQVVVCLMISLRGSAYAVLAAVVVSLAGATAPLLLMAFGADGHSPAGQLVTFGAVLLLVSATGLTIGRLRGLVSAT
jgi:hypothetical protein